MKILSARYGLPGGTSIDVSDQVRRMLVNGCLVFPESLDANILFGDPVPGQAKSLTITYADGASTPRTLVVAEWNGTFTRRVELGTPRRSPWPAARNAGRIACIYAYYEKTPDYRENLAYFLRHGLDDWIDYVFVVNGDCSIDIPEAANIRVIRRANSGFDFGGHSEGLTALTADYDHYVFLNATCRGPFLPPYAQMHWTQPFTALTSERVPLVGASIAVQFNLDWRPYFTRRFGWDRQYYPAIESYAFVLTRKGLEIASDAGVFSRVDETDYWDVVFKREIALSIAMLSKGCNIDCLIPEMRGVNYLDCYANFNPSNFTPTSPRGCWGRSLHPYEVVFFKQNRHIADAEVNSLSRYFDRPVTPPATTPPAAAGS